MGVKKRGGVHHQINWPKAVARVNKAYGLHFPDHATMLREMYVDQKLTIGQIQHILHITNKTISDEITRVGITYRRKGGTKREMPAMYVIQDLPLKEIAAGKGAPCLRCTRKDCDKFNGPCSMCNDRMEWADSLGSPLYKSVDLFQTAQSTPCAPVY
ncbi:MAG: hypothetical protein M0P69_05930 [Bacteroidales bacterium]|nr:hypothetical protein [Bacteroidales bacterium]